MNRFMVMAAVVVTDEAMERDEVVARDVAPVTVAVVVVTDVLLEMDAVVVVAVAENSVRV